MTHSVWRPSIQRAVYLVRDGRDAFVSAFHYHITRRQQAGSIEHYFDDYLAGIYGHTWATHTRTWFEAINSLASEKTLLVRFEDLKTDPQAQVKRVCDFLGFDHGRSEIDLALENASIEHARKIESESDVIAAPDQSFYRGGRSGQWRDENYTEVMSKFTQSEQHALELAGYL